MKKALAGFIGLALAASLGTGASAVTSVKRYAVPIDPGYETKAVFSVGDAVPWSKDASKSYKMVGIPDGLGAFSNDEVHALKKRWGKDTTSLFMNHEFNNTVVSEPLVGGPQYRGSFVSHWILDEDGDPISGQRAYDTVYNEDTLVGPAAQSDNSTRPFARLCSGTMAGDDEGFDRPIYFAGEESGAGQTFDSRGGSGVAFLDGKAHVLPKLGHLPYENIVVMEDTGPLTVLMVMEDGPSSPDSQLYAYVGLKNRKSNSVLARNGLNNGKLFVFAPKDGEPNSEVSFQSGSMQGQWVEIPGAEAMTETELETASDARNAFGFIRTEDGAFNPNDPHQYFFVTTGGATGNQLGRAYSLKLDVEDDELTSTLSIIYNADTITGAGGDIAVSPDNIATSDDYLMIQEDGTTQSRAHMSSKGRDGSIWRFDIIDGTVGIDPASALRVVELDPPGRDGTAVGPGVWETSGIIDAVDLFDDDTYGDDVWIFDVQAHSPTTPPNPNAVEDGQLLILFGLDDDDDNNGHGNDDHHGHDDDDDDDDDDHRYVH